MSVAPPAIAPVLDPSRTYRIDRCPPSSAHAPLMDAADRVCIPLHDGGLLIGALIVGDPPGVELPDLRLDDVLLVAVRDLLATALAARNASAAVQARLMSEAAKLRFDVVSMLSHEMRTPLASIKGYATALMLEDAAWDAATRTEFLRIIDEESDRLTRMVEDILESTAIDAGTLRIEPEPVLLPRLASRVADRLAIQSNQHRFVLVFPPRFPIVEADAQRVEQVLTNLLDNAVKYSPGGGLIVVRGETRPDEVVISVVDQGVGIAPEDLNKLFERFFRAGATPGRERVVGTGLGLPISEAIVRAHGGRIWAESTVGSGTTLSFTLPRWWDRGGAGDESEVVADEA